MSKRMNTDLANDDANYCAWLIDIDDLKNPADFIKGAVLAPSSHNSQPWSFRVEGDVISIKLEQSRQLPESDKNNRQAIISLGCATTNIEIVADYAGYACTIESGRGETIATLRFARHNRESASDKNHLAHFLTRRVTNRTPHENRPLEGEIIKEINSLASDSLRIDVITDPLVIQKLGTVAVNAGIDALEDAGFRRELSSYLKPNSTKSFIGMPGFGFGFPAVLSAIAPVLIRFFNMEKPARKQNLELFNKTASILIISTSSDTESDWISVGRAYERIALLAVQAGMATAPWAAAIQIGEHHRKIQEVLGITERPQFFARLGYPTSSTRHSPRLAANQVTI